ncbi:MAG: WbqC family protein [Deltaproteobacteria bacterium]|nr:WbqC family protein [Deltaproteobacteria bacterium]
MKGVILQPNYLPWRGYFDLINIADIFVFFDDVQYTVRDWRNRNIVRHETGSQWITVPVITKGLRGQLIKDTQIDNSVPWRDKHWAMLKHCYSRAKYFDYYRSVFEDIYSRSWENLCDLDIEIITTLCGLLSIGHTRFVRSSTLDVEGRKTERLVSICNKLGITTYISGPRAANYIEDELFDQSGIRLVYQEYNYLPYKQLYEPFDPMVSVIDLLFNYGDDSPDYIWRNNCNE